MASVGEAVDGVRKAYCSGGQPLGWESLGRGAGDRCIKSGQRHGSVPDLWPCLGSQGLVEALTGDI